MGVVVPDVVLTQATGVTSAERGDIMLMTAIETEVVGEAEVGGGPGG